MPVHNQDAAANVTLGALRRWLAGDEYAEHLDLLKVGLDARRRIITAG
jgi:hypothetical protein